MRKHATLFPSRFGPYNVRAALKGSTRYFAPFAELLVRTSANALVHYLLRLTTIADVESDTKSCTYGAWIVDTALYFQLYFVCVDDMLYVDIFFDVQNTSTVFCTVPGMLQSLCYCCSTGMDISCTHDMLQLNSTGHDAVFHTCML